MQIFYVVCLFVVVLIIVSRLILQDISWLAVQSLAEGGQGGEAHGLSLACLEDGQVRLCDSDLFCQLSGGHLPLCQHYVYVYYNWHRFIAFVRENAVFTDDLPNSANLSVKTPLFADGLYCEILFLFDFASHLHNKREQQQSESDEQPCRLRNISSDFEALQ